jgi:prolyl oligopeptidase
VFWTTTGDGRVHPGCARKMVGKIISQGHPVLYCENTEGGHGSGSSNAQAARTRALEYACLWRMLRQDWTTSRLYSFFIVEI